MRLPRKRAFLRSPFSRVVQRIHLSLVSFLSRLKKNATLVRVQQAATNRYDSLRAIPRSPDNIDEIAIKVYPRYEKLRPTSERHRVS